ncbi:MAG: cobalamin biosynthesis protein [Alphaproteobacteria bacterium]|nr:cobalamin biosynthesis protein [Alphaproteobacteria bacterium]
MVRAMTLPGLHDPLLLLYAGLVIDALFGDMSWLFRALPHPVILAGRAISWFERHLNRQRYPGWLRWSQGVLTVVLLVGIAGALGWSFQRLCRTTVAGAAAEAFVVAILVAQRSLFDHVAAVSSALLYNGLAGGRAAVSHIVGRDPFSLDGPGVARAAIESLAENFSDGVVAPAFWYLLLGLPGIFAYKMANTLDSMIGHTIPHYRAFGRAAARFDDLANLVPARLSGVLIAAAAVFSHSGRPARAVVIMLRDARKHRSPNAGWPEGAMAGALGLALAGPRRYGEVVVADPWVGDGSARAAPRDIHRALVIYKNACLILWGLVMGAWLAGHLSFLA